MRELALLHSAIARPFASFEGQDLYADDFAKSAALFHSLIKNHPFLDGTKRTAFASTLYFLERLGYKLPGKLPTDDIIKFCIDVAEENARISRGELVHPKTIDEIADWFRKLIQKA